MKKFLFLMAAMLTVAGAMAQESTSANAPEPQNKRIVLERSGNTYYYGGQKMKRTQMVDWYAQHNCQVAYEQFRSGNNVAIAGWVCLGLGLGLDIAGLSCAAASGATASSITPGKPVPPLLTAGYAMAAVGGALEIACIPCLIVGYVRMHESVNTYNTHMMARNPKPYLALQSSAAGLGLALHF